MIPYIQINIPTYELMVIIGLLAAASFLRLRNRKFEYTKKQLIWMFVAAVLGMLVGSRIVYTISKLPELVSGGTGIMGILECLFFGGFVFYGGLFGALAGIYISCRIMKLETAQAYNFAMPAIALFHMFGRIGCFLAGCCYGIAVPWGIPYLGTRRFPVQLLEAVLELLLAMWLLVYEDKLREKAAREEEELPQYSLAERYLAAYGILRFFLEFIRGDAERGFWGVFSTSQWISLIVLAVLFVKHIRKRIRRGRENE